MKPLFLFLFSVLGIFSTSVKSLTCFSSLSSPALKAIAEGVKGEALSEELSDEDKDSIKGCLSTVFSRQVGDDFFEKDLIEIRQMVEDNKETVVKTGKVSSETNGNLLVGANLADLDFSKVEADFKGAILAFASMPRLVLLKADFSDANLQGADLSYADLSGANFSNTSLKGAKLDHAWIWDATLDGTNFEKASLESANLWGASLKGVNFSSANLKGINLSTAEIDKKTQFDNAILEGAILAGTTIKETEFRGTNLDKANLSGAYISSAKFINASLNKSDLSGANLIATLFSQTSLNELKGNNLLVSKSVFQNSSSLYAANLSNAIFSDVSFAGKMDLHASTWDNAHAHDALFNKVNLLGASFKNAMLKNADFSGASLYGADLSGANITEAIFSDADVRTMIIDKNTVYQGAKEKGDKIIDEEWFKSQSVKIK